MLPSSAILLLSRRRLKASQSRRVDDSNINIIKSFQSGSLADVLYIQMAAEFLVHI